MILISIDKQILAVRFFIWTFLFVKQKRSLINLKLRYYEKYVYFNEQRIACRIFDIKLILLMGSSFISKKIISIAGLNVPSLF